ncbi:MAG: tRNA-binding protein [Flavobacteriales bacterium]
MQNNLTWQEFSKVEMRVGTILTANEFPEANNPAFILTIDFGELGIKKTSAQITQLYKTEELIGKQIVAVVNLPKKQIATMQSECLVLGGIGNEKNVTLLTLDKPIENGARIG